MARLMLFFSLSFIIIFVFIGGISYLRLALDAARTIPVGPKVELRVFFSSLQAILPLILYVSILMGLSYTARRGIPLPLAVFSLLILAGGAALGGSLGLRRLKSVDIPRLPLFSSQQTQGARQTLGTPGLILSQGDTVVVVLGDPGQPNTPRAVSIPGRPLIYQEVPWGPNNTITALPPAPFRDEESYLLKGLLTDSALAAEQFETRMNEGLIPFAIYGGALIFLLVSLRFVLDLSSWPLANFFLGALVFRGILAFQTFLDSQSVQDIVHGFLAEWVDISLLSPVIFGILALLIFLYTFLVNLSRSTEHRQRGPDRRKRSSEPFQMGADRRQANRRERSNE
jgi:hypothetical protein